MNRSEGWVALASRKRRRPSRSRLLLRWAVVIGACLVALAYYKPARSYFHARGEVSQRAAEVRTLRAQHAHLQRLVAASASDTELAREARRLGLVKPGERLFIVKGINRWLKRHATLGGRE
jgi:outer membrane murein-binding lipoprotein Lpp